MEQLGYHLRSSREQLGISIEELSNATRIDLEYLKAMEQGDFDSLPGPVYIRSYLRTYSIYVNLDPRKMIKMYQMKKEASGEQLSRTTRVQREMELQRSDENTSLSRSKKQEFGRSSEKMVTMSRAAAKNQTKTKKTKTKKNKKKVSGFAKFYNGLLIAGFLLLLVGTGIVLYLRLSTTEVAEISDKVIPLTAFASNVMLG
ncbi:helix-turn-helix domain-containing protein [Shimazuella kribbensis]|uniref:helix-turn-helix domain-containing protein n=1 Tax=Shimazuella kribbensis TaxID=139808 RepID=UPI0003FCF792|nr:helix-turn-helix domain-containing protein [Shimazuella kribbensis]